MINQLIRYYYYYIIITIIIPQTSVKSSQNLVSALTKEHSLPFGLAHHQEGFAIKTHSLFLNSVEN